MATRVALLSTLVLSVLLGITPSGFCGELLSYDVSIAGVHLFALPAANNLEGGVVFNGSTAFFGGTKRIYSVAMNTAAGQANLLDTIQLPAEVTSIASIEGPAPFTSAVETNGTWSVSFCSQIGSYGGGLVRVNMDGSTSSNVQWLSEPRSISFQNCIGDPSTGNTYLIDSGAGNGEIMNARVALAGSEELSLDLPLPVVSQLPGNQKVTIQTAIDSVGRLMFVSGVYQNPDSPVLEWSWGITVVDLDSFQVLHVIPVARIPHTSATSNSVAAIWVADGSLFTTTVACSNTRAAGEFCTTQADDSVTVLAYPLQQLRALRNMDDDGQSGTHISASAVGTVMCPSAVPGLLLVVDYEEHVFYLGCDLSNQLVKVSASDLTTLGRTCYGVVPNGFGVLYASNAFVTGVAYMAVASVSGTSYIATVEPGAMAFADCKFYDKWYFYVSIVGGAVALTALLVCIYKCCNRRKPKNGSARKYLSNSASSGLYQPPAPSV